jgi:cytidylate kinase/osmotically-inducible protein OsmY
MPIITISRGSLSGGKMLAQQLGARLGFSVISREVIIEAAQEYGVSEEDIVKGLESPPGLWERLVGRKERYILAIRATLTEKVESGNAIYHGIAGQLLLKEVPNVIKVRLIAPLDQRIRAAMAQGSTSREEAIKQIHTADMLRAQWVRRMYNAEWNDPSLYDLVVNLEHMDLHTATELVVGLAKSKEFEATPASARVLKDVALAARVRAVLRFKSEFPEEAIDATVHDGVVHLSGGPFFENNRRDVVLFVKSIPGVESVTPDIESEALESHTLPQIGKTAADVMVPLTGYPHIHEWVTIREAMMALGASSVVLTDGHLISPRYVVVLDPNNQIVGVIGRRNLLRGLTPQFAMIQRAKAQVESMAALTDMGLPVTLRWNSLFSKAALAASWEPVKSVMAPIRGTVNVEDSLSTVVTTMIYNSVDLIPVVDDQKAVGVILMTDVFDTVAQFILEKGTERPV